MAVAYKPPKERKAEPSEEPVGRQDHAQHTGRGSGTGQGLEACEWHRHSSWACRNCTGSTATLNPVLWQLETSWKPTVLSEKSQNGAADATQV